LVGAGEEIGQACVSGITLPSGHTCVVGVVGVVGVVVGVELVVPARLLTATS
jgi:hypothetical protein